MDACSKYLGQIAFRPETNADGAAMAALHDAVFGPGRAAKPVARVRERAAPIFDAWRVATEGDRLLAGVRFWRVDIGGRPCALLGPLAVAAEVQGQGIGRALMADGLRALSQLGYARVFLTGDPVYYAPFGFYPDLARQIDLGGPQDPGRILYCALSPGAWDGVEGRVQAPNREVIVLPSARPEADLRQSA